MSTSDTNGKAIMSGFPAGLRMLVVEGNQSCNFVLETMLKKLQYQVTTCRGAREALELLREDKSRIDLVLSDLHMPDMDGFELLRILYSEMDLPVVIMSGDDDRIDVIMRVIIDGACDYLIKPISEEVAKVMWQHVVRKKKDIYLGESSRKNVQDNGDQALILKQPDHHAEESNHMSLQLVENEGNIKMNIKRNRDYDQDGSEVSDNRITNQKKRRIIWTNELHEKFVIAVNQLGGDKAVPKKILERMKEMDVGDLSRENVASHLQKYRIYLQRQTEGPHGIEPSLSYMDDKRSIFEQYSSSESDHHGISAPIIPNSSIVVTPSVVDQGNPNRHSHYCSMPSFSSNLHGCITKMSSWSDSGSGSMLPNFYNNLPLPSDQGYQFKPIENNPQQFSRTLSGINNDGFDRLPKVESIVNETSFDHVNMFDSRFTGTHFIPLTDFCNSSSSTPHDYCSLGAADHANLVPYITNMGNNIDNQNPKDVLPMAECENMSDLLMSEPQPLYYVKPFDHQNESLDGGSPFM